VNNELTPKQQTSEAIRQAETILITTGQHPSVDQVAATLALAAILRKFGKKVSAIISDSLPQSAQFMDTAGLDRSLSGLRDFVLKVDVSKSEVDKLRYEVEDSKLNVYITPFKGGFAPSDVTFGYGDFHYDIAVVLGVPTRARIDRVYADNQGLFNSIPVINLDFHRTNEGYGAINLIEPTASSLCEILVATSESLQAGLIDADIATIMLAGLMASTDRFTATHTTSKSLTVAAQMMAAGAKQQQVVKGLFRDGRDRPERAERSDRPERNERGDRSRNGDRGDREQRNGDRPERSERPRQAEPRQEQPRAEQPAEQPLVRPQVHFQAEQPAERPQAERSERPEASERPERRPEPSAATHNPDADLTAAPDTPESEAVIQPDHIEPSIPPQADLPNEAPQAEPVAIPMADFAAAAEMLRDRSKPASAEAEQAEDGR